MSFIWATVGFCLSLVLIYIPWRLCPPSQRKTIKQKRRWLINYSCIALGCDAPILKAIYYALTESVEAKAQALLKTCYYCLASKHYDLVTDRVDNDSERPVHAMFERLDDGEQWAVAVWLIYQIKAGKHSIILDAPWNMQRQYFRIDLASATSTDLHSQLVGMLQAID